MSERWGWAHKGLHKHLELGTIWNWTELRHSPKITPGPPSITVTVASAVLLRWFWKRGSTVVIIRLCLFSLCIIHFVFPLSQCCALLMQQDRLLQHSFLRLFFFCPPFLSALIMGMLFFWDGLLPFLFPCARSDNEIWRLSEESLTRPPEEVFDILGKLGEG